LDAVICTEGWRVARAAFRANGLVRPSSGRSRTRTWDLFLIRSAQLRVAGGRIRIFAAFEGNLPRACGPPRVGSGRLRLPSGFHLPAAVAELTPRCCTPLSGANTTAKATTANRPQQPRRRSLPQWCGAGAVRSAGGRFACPQCGSDAGSAALAPEAEVGRERMWIRAEWELALLRGDHPRPNEPLAVPRRLGAEGDVTEVAMPWLPRQRYGRVVSVFGRSRRRLRELGLPVSLPGSEHA
jgi:hypothetical protein